MLGRAWTGCARAAAQGFFTLADATTLVRRIARRSWDGLFIDHEGGMSDARARYQS